MVVMMMMMVMVVVVMVFPSGERRAGKHHQHQDGGKNLFHDKNVARGRPGWKRNAAGPQMPGQRPLQLVDPLAGNGREAVKLQLTMLLEQFSPWCRGASQAVERRERGALALRNSGAKSARFRGLKAPAPSVLIAPFYIHT
jgi:hypothetical protein